ncbi:MAG TPA: NAD(P)-dependent oxidoreductase [Bacteroidota bacterium]|nr:NAD(P)-dependent oxidoreductase [Bacteroidota bacterium]
MKIFIAGATGVLGRRVVRLLTEHGHEVTGLARSPQNEAFLNSMNARSTRVDIFDRAALIRAVHGHDAVLHLATKIPTKSRPRRSDWNMNDRLRTEGTQNLILATLESDAKVYVQESIVHLYNRTDGAVVDERAPLLENPPFPLRSALAMEHVIEQEIARHRLPAIILRFGGFYGHDAANTQSLLNGVRRGAVPVISRGEYFWNLIHLDDAARAVVAAVQTQNGNLRRAYNIVDSNPVTMKELVHGLAEILNAPSPRSIPTALARLVVGGDALKFMQISLRASNAAARRALGWTPSYPSYREGIKQVLSAVQNTVEGTLLYTA